MLGGDGIDSDARAYTKIRNVNEAMISAMAMAFAYTFQIRDKLIFYIFIFSLALSIPSSFI